MLAANCGFVELFKLYYNMGSDYLGKDAFQFSALLYAVKSNCMPIILYLIAQGADVHDLDRNSSGLQHWSAYNNNAFLLEFYNTIGLDLHTRDN